MEMFSGCGSPFGPSLEVSRDIKGIFIAALPFFLHLSVRGAFKSQTPNTQKETLPRQSESLFCVNLDRSRRKKILIMRLHETGAKASSLSRCTHITTSAFGTLPISKAYSIQSIIDNNEDLKALNVFQKSTTLKSKTNTLENEIDHKKDRNYIASGLSKINSSEYNQETISGVKTYT